MQLKRQTLEPTKLKLSITAEATELSKAKADAIKKLGQDAKLPGFRAGKAPSQLIEKELDPALLQSEVMNQLINRLVDQAIRTEAIKIVSQPSVTITKFVPYTTLEFSAELEAVGDIKLANYRKLKLALIKPEPVKPAEISSVIDSLRQRAATRQSVKRAAKDGDELDIDFSGIDPKTKEPIAGTDAQNYNLLLGSKTFIPGFEKELIGLKPKQAKTFLITFPADYGVAALQKAKVSFTVKVNDVKELVMPKLDDAFAKTTGPFKSLAELKIDIKKQLQSEKQNEADQNFNNQMLQKIADGTEVAIPGSLIEQEMDRLDDEEKRSVAYRGQTWQEHLDQEGFDSAQHREKQRPIATMRIKTGLILGAISDQEDIRVSEVELSNRLNELKKQYSADPAMLAELDKDSGKNDIHSRMLIEATIKKLKQLIAKQ